MGFGSFSNKMPVYFITEQLEPDIEPRSVKIGYSNNVERRKRDLQTGNSHLLRIMGYIQSSSLAFDKKIERELHQKYTKVRKRGEWFVLYPSDVMDALQCYSSWGYLSCGSSPFEITGYDRKGIPEFASPWDWGDFDFAEFCPVCGWACGWTYNENILASHCLECGASDHDFEMDRYSTID